MGIALEQPLYLLALPVLFLVAWLGYRNRSEYLTNWKTGCLVGAGICISIAASAPTVTIPGSPEHRVLLVDVSDSSNLTNEEVQTSFETWTQDLDASDRFSVLLFANESEWLAKRLNPAASVELNQIADVRERLDGSASNPADALNTTLATQRTKEQLVPVLISDGQFTEQQREQVESIADRRGISIHTKLSRTRTWPDVWIEQVRSPSYVDPGTSFELQVRLRSTGSYNGEIRVSRPDDQRTITSVPFSIRKNQTRTFRLTVKASKQAYQRYRIKISVDGEEWSLRNNSFTTGVRSSDTFNLLWTGSRDLFERIAPALETSNRSLAYQKHPTRTEPFDLFLLAGPASEATEEWQNQLAKSIRSRGSGLVMLGTNQTFARGGWAGTAIEELLPVRVFPPDRLSLSVLLDVSGSMSDAPDQESSAGSKLHVVRNAVLSSLQLLKPADRLELRSFSDTPRLLRPLGKLGRPHDLNDTLQKLSAGGETRLLPALKTSITSLAGTPPENRYILIFTDGQLSGGRDDFRALSRKAADQQIEFVILTSGDQADQSRLSLLTDGGSNGRVISLDSIQAIGSKLQEEMERIRKFIRAGTTGTNISPTTWSILPEERERLPQATGSYHRVTEKRLATTAIRSKPHEEPLVSAWQPGWGRSITLTPLFDRPGSLSSSNQTAWIRALRQSVEWALPKRPSDWTMRTDISSKRLTIFAKQETDAESLRSIRANASLVDETDDKQSMQATTLSPDELRFQTDRPESGSYQFSAEINTNGERTQLTLPVNIPVEREYLHPWPDGSYLKDLSTRTGGQFLAPASETTSIKGNLSTTSRSQMPAERYFMMLAGLFLLLVLVRR
jgi:hypothetical protein